MSRQAEAREILRQHGFSLQDIGGIVLELKRARFEAACAAMQGLLASPVVPAVQPCITISSKQLAKEAVALADALLAALDTDAPDAGGKGAGG